MKLLYPLFLSLLLQACGGGGGGGDAVTPGAAPGPTAAPAPAAAPAQAACSIADQRQALNDHMSQDYLWYRQAAAPDPNAVSMDAYFKSLLYRPLDRYSHSQPTASHQQTFVEGRRTGYGYTVVWNDAARTSLRVRNVEALSPVARAGLVRGDTILSIDGYTPEQVAGGQLAGVTTTGVPRVFRVRGASGTERTFTVQSEDFPLMPVPTKAVLDGTRAGLPVKVGYLVYHQFVRYSGEALNQAFTEFAAQGVSEVILDLRYNGGGSVAVSRDLASMLGGSRTSSKPYTTLRYNDKQTASNTTFAFNGGSALPGLDRVIVIGSGFTASASELVINGLRPYMNVVLVGETTFGKPYGSVPRAYCGTTYSAIQFEAVNSLGASGYSSGLTPDCQVADDLDRQLGDPGERRIRAALDYVATGRCSAAPLQRLDEPVRKIPSVAFGETVPEQMYLQ